MGDYGRVFGEEVALGLGLGQPSKDETIEQYKQDPASAFSRMAELMQLPEGTVSALAVHSYQSDMCGKPRPA